LHGLFITGTDTGVGKTYVACGIVSALRSRGVRVGAYKPVVSGSLSTPEGPVWEDVLRLQAALGGNHPADRICPQRLRHWPRRCAARRCQVDAALRSGLDCARTGRLVVVEGPAD
jgi:dethiobiotin synthetase